MRSTSIIIDNFFENPEEIVAYAKTLKFVYPYMDNHSDKGPAWTSTRYISAKDCPLKSNEALVNKIEFYTNTKIDRKCWNAEYPIDELGISPMRNGTGQFLPGDPKNYSPWWNCTFHVKYNSTQKMGEGVHDHTDRDAWSAVGDDGWAGLVYLSKNARFDSGLRTWKNKVSNHQRFTRPENWMLIDSFGAVYNRLILHRGDIPHSGAPGWGNNIENGRMFLTLFARILPEEKQKPVKIHLPSGS